MKNSARASARNGRQPAKPAPTSANGNEAGARNFAVLAAPGAGKSALLDEIVRSYVAAGAKVCVIDHGRTFEKWREAGGDDLAFKPNVDLNPFSFAKAHRP